MTGTMIENVDVGEKEIGIETERETETETGIETETAIGSETTRNMNVIGIEKGIGKVGSGIGETGTGTVGGGGAIQGAEVGVGIARIVTGIIVRDTLAAA